MNLHCVLLLTLFSLVLIFGNDIGNNDLKNIDDIRSQVPVDFAANLIRFHRLNIQETNKLFKIVFQDSDCKIENSNDEGNYFRRLSPCFYATRFYQAGGKPWYWSNDIKPFKWNELNEYYETHNKGKY